MPIPEIRIKIWGELACFTRPETKVERVSYPLMTPSAARNILDAICWRPEMRWIVTSIAVNDTGAWAAGLAKYVGLDLPVQPLRERGHDDAARTDHAQCGLAEGPSLGGLRCHVDAPKVPNLLASSVRR